MTPPPSCPPLGQVYNHLKTTGSSIGVEEELTDFMSFSKMMGFERVWEFERAHADWIPERK